MKSKIIQGDCIEEMKKLLENSVDCIITDPPFNISQDKKELSRKTMNSPMFAKRTSIRLDFGDWDKMGEEDFKLFTEIWFKECARILKDKGWFFCFFSKERIGYFTDPIDGLFIKNGFKTRTIISWHKTNPVPSFRKVNFLSSCEFCVVGSKGKSRLPNFLMQKEMHNFFETPNKSSYGKTKHPTEKPEILIEWIVKIGSNEQEIILDPFGGSGTTAIACIKNNRKYILIEKDEGYVEIIKERIKPFLEQKKLK